MRLNIIQKNYTDGNIVYFEDYSIEKVIELSEVSKKWNEKFRLADERKEDFLNLPICKKVKKDVDKGRRVWYNSFCQ